MTDDNKRRGVSQELRSAHEAHREAALLRQAGMLRGATNRLYYSLFHTLLALLFTAGLQPRKHRALPRLIREHFGELLTPEEIAFVTRLSQARDQADYDGSWNPSGEFVDQTFADADALIARVRAHLTDGGWLAPPTT